jgi:hypothetical protein
MQGKHFATFLLPFHVLPLLLLFASLSIAQSTRLIPGGSVNEGTSNSAYPFRSSNAKGHRVQFCYSTAWSSPVVINTFSIRAKAASCST